MALPRAVLLVNVVVSLLMFILVVRTVLTTIAAWAGRERLGRALGKVNDYLIDVTEPVLSPLRRVLPDMGLALDFSPLVAIIALDLIGRLLTFALLRVL